MFMGLERAIATVHCVHVKLNEHSNILFRNQNASNSGIPEPGPIVAPGPARSALAGIRARWQKLPCSRRRELPGEDVE